jgi:hypothetical protein
MPPERFAEGEAAQAAVKRMDHGQRRSSISILGRLA